MLCFSLAIRRGLTCLLPGITSNITTVIVTPAATVTIYI